MLICEELFLLLTTKEGSADPWVANQGQVLSGALLVDLVQDGWVGFEGDGSDPHVVITKGLHAEAFPGNPVLASGIEALSSRKPVRASVLVASGWFSPRATIATQLAASGIVTIEAPKALGLVLERYPKADEAPEQAIRARLSTVLHGQRDASPSDAVILALLQQVGAVGRVLAEQVRPLKGGALREKIKEITTKTLDENVAVGAVRRAVDSLQAVISGAAIGGIG